MTVYTDITITEFGLMQEGLPTEIIDSLTWVQSGVEVSASASKGTILSSSFSGSASEATVWARALKPTDIPPEFEGDITLTLVVDDPSGLTQYSGVWEVTAELFPVDPEDPTKGTKVVQNIGSMNVTVPYTGYGTLTVPDQYVEIFEIVKSYVDSGQPVPSPNSGTEYELPKIQAFESEFEEKLLQYQSKTVSDFKITHSNLGRNNATLTNGCLTINKNSEGYWFVGATVRPDVARRDMEIELYLNGSRWTEISADTSSSNFNTSLVAMVQKYLKAGDKITMKVKAGTAGTVRGTFTGYRPVQ